MENPQNPTIDELLSKPMDCDYFSYDYFDSLAHNFDRLTGDATLNNEGNENFVKKHDEVLNTPNHQFENIFMMFFQSRT